ncbi:kinesin-like protein KIN-12D isoform X3 [Physcomitrium patens]|uniref:kinesin-like protein KIN-12D isoform X3 n=1 Tax=Physcomitrium patens TaxID=3218 RepID=UPI000D176097|nr:kinesin-like protein KIN-12D isoform X3 [Physcomitrium patens]|eukprot:XP_024376033.1 kinesin-like protein KIN-12D isoform X3 [Physcomitrella patens]
MTILTKSTSLRSFRYNGTASPGTSPGFVGLRSAMASSSPKHHRTRDASVEFNNQFSDTSSSSSSTCSDLSIPSCSSSSLYSGYTSASSKTGYDSASESASSTPRSTSRTTPVKNIPRPGKPGVPHSAALVHKGSQRGLLNSHSMKGGLENVPSFELQEDPDFWNDHNVQVLVRTRPVSNSESVGAGFTRCVRQDSAHTITWLGQPETRFTFDHVAGESITQEDIFRVAGSPMVDNCLRGYNSCMFAYGQTGSGKTHTMLGDIDDLDCHPSHQRGVTPRIFEYLFATIQQEVILREQEHLRFVCKCSFLEIYNEHITDLLDPSSTNLHIREDAKTGVYVENLKEVEVKSVHDVVQLLIQGASNRRVAATNMNRESSRSHSVFACSVESKWESNSLTNIRFGRLNLVDLAGSERQKSSGAEGDRLKEAANINKSLSTLGLVIMILVDVANGKERHIPYRDSKLTFLLQDSLGGNSKTTIIATISPSNVNALETLSTLKFAQRAKFIRNSAHVNEDSSGDVNALRREIQQLKNELNILKEHGMSATQTMEGDHLNISAMSPAQKQSSNNLHHKIRAVEATLAASLRREQQAQLAAKQYATEVDQLQSLVQQRDQSTQSGRMILRFRDDKIRRLEAVVAGKLPVDYHLLEDNKRLAEELELVKAQVDRNPELTRFAMDNIRLMEQVRGFQEFHQKGERTKMMEEIANLRDQLLEMTEAKLTLEQGAIALSNSQADKYRKELEICCNDLSTCLEINSTLTKELEQLKQQVAQLNTRCQEQQQDLDFLKAQPMGRVEELELERSVHLQIIEGLKAQLQQQKESENRIAQNEDMRDVVEIKHTVHRIQSQGQIQDNVCITSEVLLPQEDQVQVDNIAIAEREPCTQGFTTEVSSLFDEDIEQLSVCDEKQAAMETEFETFSELMVQKESLLDEDLDKLDVCTKRQSLESEFETYAVVMEERSSYLSEEAVRQKVHAKTLEMASHFEPFTELMEGEELLLRESLEQLNIGTKTVAGLETDNLGVVASRDNLDIRLDLKPEISTSVESLPAVVEADSSCVVALSTQAKLEMSSNPFETERAGPKNPESTSEQETSRNSSSEDVSHRCVEFVTKTATVESMELSEGRELNLSALDILQEDLDAIRAGVTENASVRLDATDSILINADNKPINVEVTKGGSTMGTEIKSDSETSTSGGDVKAPSTQDGDVAST